MTTAEAESRHPFPAESPSGRDAESRRLLGEGRRVRQPTGRSPRGETNRVLIAIIGPTAVGKTAVALQLAEELPALVEVVSADSRQIYRHMDIGTAKPTAEERLRARHHLLDIVEPDQPLSLAQYQHLAYGAIEDIQRRGRIPLLVGGTGLYVRAVLDGLKIPHVAPDSDLRQRLYAEAEAVGCERLHQRLRQVDPVAAERIDARNVRRVIRALEVCYSLGKPMSSVQDASPPPYRVLRVGLTMPRALLYQRIDERIERMMASGLVQEVRWLAERGFSCHLPAMSSVGYREVGMYLRAEATLEQAGALIKRHTRRLVRQQYNWFRESDPRIVWFDASQPVLKAVLERVHTFLNREGKD